MCESVKSYIEMRSKLFPGNQEALSENINRNMMERDLGRFHVNENYYKNTLKVTLFPFVFWGIPTNKLFVKQKTLITSEWLTIITKYSNPCSTLLTILVFIVAISINGYVFYSFGNLFYEFVIKADPSSNISGDLNVLMQLGPIIVPINYIWLFGYTIRNLIESFDRVTIPITHSYHVELPVYVSTRPSGRSTLFIMYFIIFVMYSVQFTLLYYRIRNGDTNVKAAIEYVYNSVFYTLTFPVYATLCGAVRYEFQLLFSYINLLMEDKESTQMIYLDDFKRAYKMIADQILQINRHCSLYLSLVFLVISLSLYQEVMELGVKAIQIVTEEDINFRPFEIRTLIGDIFVILSYAGLGIFTVWQAVQTNDDARYMHVWLNDFVTTPSAKLSTETYQAVSV